MDIASKSKYGKNTPSKTNNGNDQKSNDKDNEKKVSFNSSTKRSRISDDAPWCTAFGTAEEVEFWGNRGPKIVG
jgi:hypothetical protein